MNVKFLLDRACQKYNCKAFIEDDPISIPHRFSMKENIEISGFLTSTIAWGQRKTILNSAGKLMNMLDNSPFDFVMNATKSDYNHVKHFVHRTFQGVDLIYFLTSLRNIYVNYHGLEGVFNRYYKQNNNIKFALAEFNKLFFELPYHQRTRKHVANVINGASAKRLNMFLRWMVRNDEQGVDFGIWKCIPSSALFLPLDVHTGNISRQLGILQRKQNDWKAVEEVTAILREFDPEDPVKYDFALFGMGVFEKHV